MTRQSVVRLIENNYFAAIQLDSHLPDRSTLPGASYSPDGVARGLFTENMLTAIGRHYYVIRRATSGDILVPR